MAEGSTPTHGEPRETKTLQFARFIVRNRFPVSVMLILTSLFFFYPILNMIMTTLGTPLPGPIVRVDTFDASVEMLRSGQVTQTLQWPIFWLPWVIGFCCIVVLLVIVFNLLHPNKEMIKP